VRKYEISSTDIAARAHGASIRRAPDGICASDAAAMPEKRSRHEINAQPRRDDSVSVDATGAARQTISPHAANMTLSDIFTSMPDDTTLASIARHVEPLFQASSAG